MRKAKGFSLIYTIVAMTTFCMIVSLGVDLGRVQLAKLEIRRSSDVAARAGIAAFAGADGTAGDIAYGQAEAVSYAALNKVDGKGLTVTPSSDIQFGTWDVTKRKFTALAGDDRALANAMRISAHRDGADAIQLAFASILGRRSCKVTAESIAMFTPVNVNDSVPGTANPFLAGMKKGSVASSNNNPSGRHNYDIAGDSSDPQESPILSGLPVSNGADFTFDTISGTVKHDPSLPEYLPDGQLDDIGHNNLTTDYSNNYLTSHGYQNQNGISDINCPIDALVGVFLDDSDPSKTDAPTIDTDNCPQDYSSAANRNRAEYHPALKQIFFIGDGLTDGKKQQKFVAPKGATRLFLATWDFYEWRNNDGNRTIKVHHTPLITIVK